MIKLISNLFFLAAVFSAVTVSQPVWVNQNPRPQCNTLNDVKFTGTNTLYIAGNYGTIMKSTNAGANWVSQVSGTTENLEAVFFVNANTGFIAGGAGNSLVLKTTNGGTNWGLTDLGGSFGLQDVYFADANTGYLSGIFGTVYKTTNSGVNWNTLAVPSTANFYSVF